MIVYDGKTLAIKNTILYFYTNWMPMHVKMFNFLNSLHEFSYNIIVIDCESFPDMRKANNIKIFPTFVFYKEKKVKKELKGLQSQTTLLSTIKEIYEI